MGSFNDVLGRLKSFRVLHWGDSSEEPSKHERVEADLNQSQVTSSLLKDKAPTFKTAWAELAPNKPLPSSFVDESPEDNGDRHIIVLDVDYPTYLLESSTPGHHHLVIEIPPVSRARYFAFLQACAEVGLIEFGYKDASQARGHSDIRLPWVKKDDPLPDENQLEFQNMLRVNDGLEPWTMEQFKLPGLRPADPFPF